MGKYKNQIILNFGFSNAKWVKRKWDKHNDAKQCVLIDVIPEDKLALDDKFSPLAELTSRSRLYLYLHGDRSGEFFSSDQDKDYSYKEIANFLALYLKDSSLSTTDSSPLKISLISCEAGRGKGGDYLSSTAANLHRALKEQGINTEVVARIYKMKLNKGKKDAYTKETISRDFYPKQLDYTFKHKQPGSKVIFRWDSKGEQIVEDAYQVSWKEKALDIISSCAENTNVSSKKKLLLELHSNLQDQPVITILTSLKEIVEDKKSFIDEHSNYSFFRKTNTRKAFESLIEEGAGLADSPFVIKPTHR